MIKKMLAISLETWGHENSKDPVVKSAIVDVKETPTMLKPVVNDKTDIRDMRSIISYRSLIKKDEIGYIFFDENSMHGKSSSKSSTNIRTKVWIAIPENEEDQIEEITQKWKEAIVEHAIAELEARLDSVNKLMQDVMMAKCESYAPDEV